MFFLNPNFKNTNPKTNTRRNLKSGVFIKGLVFVIKNLPRKNKSLDGFMGEFSQLFKEEIIGTLPNFSLENRKGDSSQLFFLRTA